MKKKINSPKLTYKKYVQAIIKAENERAEEDKQVWRGYIKDFSLIQGLPPVQKANSWLWQVVIKDDSLEGSESWVRYFIDNEFEDQEALIYFISRGIDCSEYIQNMYARLKQHKQSSEEFSNFLESMPDKELRFLGIRKHKSHRRKLDEQFTMSEAMWRSTPTIANDDQSFLTASMFRTIGWCDIGGLDDMLGYYSSRLKEDVARGGEIEEELANQFLFNICRSDLAIEIMGENLVKLLARLYPFDTLRKVREERE